MLYECSAATAGYRRYPRSKVLHPHPLRSVGAVHRGWWCYFLAGFDSKLCFPPKLDAECQLEWPWHHVSYGSRWFNYFTNDMYTVYLFHISYIHTNAKIYTCKYNPFMLSYRYNRMDDIGIWLYIFSFTIICNNMSFSTSNEWKLKANQFALVRQVTRKMLTAVPLDGNLNALMLPQVGRPWNHGWVLKVSWHLWMVPFWRCVLMCILYIV